MTRIQNNKQAKSGLKRFLSLMFWAFLIAFLVRTFLFQPFSIPSSSMEPNLIKGDLIVTSKYRVGYGRYAADPLPFPSLEKRLLQRGPNYGDIIVFKTKGDGARVIKRVAGLPGDRVQISGGTIRINGKSVISKESNKPVDLKTKYFGAKVREETLGDYSVLTFDNVQNHPADNTDIVEIPAGFYFVIGDNRDHSLDSRIDIAQGGTGLVPSANIIGRAEFILLSADEGFSVFRPGTWDKFRGNRFLVGLR